MKKLLLYPSLMLLLQYGNAQTFTHGTVGINNERVTHCLVSTCSGTYLDNGGAGGNYALNIAGGLYRVFCPNAAGQCMRATFNTYRTEGTAVSSCNFDYLTVGNGATQNSPVMTLAGVTTGTGRICGAPATPFTFTANNPSGCLAFRFTSDFSVTDIGWSASLSCVPCATAGNGPSLTANNDCARATPLCSGTTNNFNASGPGLAAEGCTGSACPAGGENHSNWYRFQISVSGTLRFTITPQTATDDYDFAVYGPNVTCNTLGAPLRCSDSGGTGATGLNTTAVDVVEDVNGDKFLAQMNVVAGQVYYLVVDEWTANTGGGYALGFAGTASLNCVVLPLEMTLFESIYDAKSKSVNINWETEREVNITYYDVEKSYDGVNFERINTVQVSGNSYEHKSYSVKDNNPSFDGITYYRLKYGSTLEEFSEYSEVVAVEVHDDGFQTVMVQPNPFDNITNVQFYVQNTGEAKFKIMDISGAVVASFDLAAVQGINAVDLDLSGLANGFYLMQLSIDGKNHHKKIIKN